MTINATRQPKGIPVGGQFAATAHAEPSAVLAVNHPFEGLVDELLETLERDRRALRASSHAVAHESIISDVLTTNEEQRVARSAVQEALISGDFGADTAKVRDLVRDDRLVRQAVDRYVVTESQEPGSYRPEEAGHRLGRILIDLQNEDIEDAVYGIERGVEE